MIIPSLQHLIYIPAVLGTGILIGWFVGARGVRNEWARAEKRRRQQEEDK